MDGENRHHCKGYLRPFLVVLVLALTAFLIAKTASETAKPKEFADVSQISVSGEGKVFAKPDVARINIGAVTEGKTASEAQNRNAEIINKTTEFLKAEGVEEKDIKTTNYSISPRYDYIERKRILRGYEVSQTLEVKIRNLDKTGRILGGVAERGANEVGGLIFVVDKEETLKQEARAKAIKSAKEKAEILAKELGVKLGRVIGFGEYGYLPAPVMYKAEMTALGGAAPEIPTGENEIIVNVSISYEIK